MAGLYLLYLWVLIVDLCFRVISNFAATKSLYFCFQIFIFAIYNLRCLFEVSFIAHKILEIIVNYIKSQVA